MHLSHVRVPFMSVQSHVSDCTGRAAAVSSQRSCVDWKNDCISGLMSHGSCAPMTFCGLPLGPDESQSANIDTARSRTESRGGP